ncbi:FtsX-like permease family protein, partial [Candidatus Shapirobacteria bacterium]|nr:FtsX-like permease family protein [Candidatus Shapirobacteria bacterium]
MEKLFETLKLALITLRANKLRSLLTMLGIIIGVSSVILLISIGSGLKTYITGQLQDLGSNSLYVVPGNLELQPGGGGSGGTPGAGAAILKFTLAHYRELTQKGTTLKAIMGYSEHNGTVSYGGRSKTMQVAGVGYQYPEVRNQYPELGTFFNASQQEAAKKVIVLGKTVADDLFPNENPVGKKITLSDNKFTVLGVLEEKGAFGAVDMDNQVFIPFTTAMSTFDVEKIMSFWIEAKENVPINEAKEEVRQILLRTLKKDDFSVLDTASVVSVISQILGVLTIALSGIAAISLIVGGIGIMNIMLVSVTERTREIGLRKAVGATPKIIMIQFLIESMVISV